MYSRCLFCHLPFGTNDTLEAFPVGRRVAYDPGRGRLWVVCRACSRWSLAPIEERWEALDALERLTRDRGRLLAETDTVSLIRAGQMDVVRVGRAGLEEESWWRYGKQMHQRRQRYSMLHTVEKGARIIGFFTLGFVVLFAPKAPLNRSIRWLRFGSTAWRGEARCARCGGVRRKVLFRDSDRLLFGLAPEEDGIAVAARCSRCALGPLGRVVTPAGRFDPKATPGHLITGHQAEHLMRRVMAHRNFSGASERRVREAISLIDRAGSPERAVRDMAARDRHLERTVGGKHGRTHAVALEIALNDDAERRLLQMEVKALEAHWKQEEELAAIVDGELTAVPALLRRMLAGRS